MQTYINRSYNKSIFSDYCIHGSGNSLTVDIYEKPPIINKTEPVVTKMRYAG